MEFEVMPDNIQTVTSISSKDFGIDFARIDILHESIPEINKIVEIVKNGKKLQGKDFTSGNLNREI